jgi:hypothetical protein
VPHITDGANPAAWVRTRFHTLPALPCCQAISLWPISGVWRCFQAALWRQQVLEVTTEAMERRLDQDFADAYEASDLYRQVYNGSTMVSSLSVAAE